MDSVRVLLEGTIDFEGQKLAEKLSVILLTVGAVISFLIGLVSQRIELVIYVLFTFLVGCEVLVVFPWPFLRRNPIVWRIPS
jgi:signal peptidase complex subunit 1